ncbi:MAG: queuosine precursor transporter [Treponema sp.]|nr:queuosine precursor transporter [Treponema sp.]
MASPRSPVPGPRSPASFKYFDSVMVVFTAVLILSNIASSAKIVDLGFSIFGIRLAFDGGTLLFPLAYVFGDILTEVYGFKAARKAIYTGFIILAFSALVFFVLQILPGEAYWEEEAGSAAYNAILGGISSGGIVLASLAAYFVGNFSNSIMMSRIKVLMKGKWLWFRAVLSSLVGEFLDSLIFVFIACLTGVFGWYLFISLVLTNYILKCLIEALVLPLTYMVVRRLKKYEGIDTFDKSIKYTLFG